MSGQRCRKSSPRTKYMLWLYVCWFQSPPAHGRTPCVHPHMQNRCLTYVFETMLNIQTHRTCISTSNATSSIDNGARILQRQTVHSRTPAHRCLCACSLPTQRLIGLERASILIWCEIHVVWVFLNFGPNYTLQEKRLNMLALPPKLRLCLNSGCALLPTSSAKVRSTCPPTALKARRFHASPGACTSSTRARRASL